MNSAVEATPKPSPKPLALLGRDEMNLAEFPITLLTDRVPKDQKEAVYQDEIYDERSGLTLTRKLTIQAGNCGLTTAIDDEVILALIQITKVKSNFTNRRVNFSRLELIKSLGWPNTGQSYDRIKTSLDRWTSVYLQYENAWRDNRTKTWKTIGFHIIDKYELNDSRTTSDQLDLIPSYIVWGEDIFESFQAGYLKPLDYDLCMSLSNSTAKRMYRFLDKRFHHKPDWTFDLKELAHEHIGLGRHYEGPAHLKRNLLPAIGELESVGFLEPLSESDRFPRDGKSWRVRLIQKSSALPPLPVPANDTDSAALALAAELAKRGVTGATAAELVRLHPAELVRRQIEHVDWLTRNKPEKIGEPGGYLVAAIQKDYAAPKGFVSKDEEQRRENARQEKERQAAEERSRKQMADDQDRREKALVAAHWDAMSKEQQAAHDQAAIAQADAEELKLIAPGPLKRIGMGLLRDKYTRRLLQAEGKLPPAEA